MIRMRALRANQLLQCQLICVVAAIGAAAGMALSWRVWVAPMRDFATQPVSPWFDFAPEVTTGLLPIVLFGIVLGWRNWWGAAGLIAWLLITGADFMRGQPWIYQYILIACLAGGRPWACRLIMAGVYFWAGVAKLNPYFFNEVGPWLTGNIPCLKRIYFLLPFAEIAAGLALLFPGRIARWVARTLVLGISIGALIFLVSLHWNTVVWPWQAANILLVWLATGATPTPALQESPTPLPARWRGLVASFIAMAMPALIFIGLWPSYFSWRVYDGRPLVPLSLELKATDELNVPIPPEPWLLRRFDLNQESDSPESD